ncbi:MFS transporter [Tetragenococcus halophilus subsp. halophilus DSM 20339]|nr:MFS transporter [Tetragenococcus halophilus subsp. halophilus DSM 20339]
MLEFLQVALGGEFTFLLGLVIFGFSSLACALTMTAKFLIFMRIFQGIGASLLAVTGLSLISSQYPDSKQRGYALSIWSGVSGVGFAAGPLVGGGLISLFNWRAVFYINIPICLLVGIISFYFVIEQQISRSKKSYSMLSQIAAILGLATFIYTTIQISNTGITQNSIWGYLTAAVILVLLLLSERKVAHSTNKTNLFPPKLLANNVVDNGLFASFVYNFGLYGMLFVFTLVFQQTLKNSALETGLLLLPLTLVGAFTSYSIAGKLLLKYTPQNVLYKGMFFSFIGSVILLYYTVNIHYVIAVLGFIFLSFGTGLSAPSMTALVLNNAPVNYQNVSSSLVNVARQTGGVVGTSLLGVIVAKAAIAPYTTIAMAVIAVIFLLCTLVSKNTDKIEKGKNQ